MQTTGSRMACYKMWRFIWVPNVCQYFCFQKTETSLCNLVSGISVCTTDHSKCKQWGPGWRVTERGVSSGSALLVRNLYLILECRTKHPGTKHPMPFFDTPDKTSRIDLPPRTKHPMQFLSPRTKHPMPFLPPWTKHPMLFLPPRTKHPTLCLKPMIVHKTSHLVNCHYH